MSEKNAYQNIRNNILKVRPKGSVYLDRFDRVENAIGSGMPDVNYCIEGIEGWLEIKSPVEPKRPTTPLFGSNHNVSQEQINWFCRQRQSGGNSFLLIQTNKRYMLIGQYFVDEINSLCMPDLLDYSFWTVERPVMNPSDWVVLRELLCRKH